MTVSLFQWHAVIGISNCWMSVVSTNCERKLNKNFITMLEILLICYYYFQSTSMSFLTLLYIFILLQCHGDIEKNLGPRKIKKNPSQYAIGILIVYLLIIFQKLLSWEHIFQCINTISYAYQKLTWIPQYMIVCSK